MNELIDIDVAGLIQVIRMAGPDDAALVHHDNTVGNMARAIEITGNGNDRRAAAVPVLRHQIMDDIGQDGV